MVIIGFHLLLLPDRPETPSFDLSPSLGIYNWLLGISGRLDIALHFFLSSPSCILSFNRAPIATYEAPECQTADDALTQQEAC